MLVLNIKVYSILNSDFSPKPECREFSLFLERVRSKGPGILALLCKSYSTLFPEKSCETRGGGLPYENDGDARRKNRIIPLKETNLGVVQALFDPKRDHA